MQLDRLWSGEIQLVDIEKRYRRKDGSFLWVRTSTALVRDGSRTECSVEYQRDITHRKELAAALLQQQTLLEAVLTDLPVALLVCDVAGNITHYNRAAVDLYCIPKHTPPSQDPYPLAADVFLMDGVTPVDRANRPLACALRGETVTNLELLIVPRDSRPARSTLSNARRLIGPDGQTLGAVAVIQDMTDLKRQEMELERVHKELMTASRQAGMAEVATNVLHNVGNILNSVNISASLVAERVRQSKAPGVSRLAALLVEQGPRAGQFITDDERGRRIPDYLAALGEQLLADQRMTLQELASLRDNLEHIKDTVAMQQSYAKLCGVTETVEVVDLVEDSLRLNAGAFARHGVTLKREFGNVPPITVDKHKVLQILVNLVRNAKYACDDSGRSDKLITLRIEGTDAGGAHLGHRQRYRDTRGEHAAAVQPRLHHAQIRARFRPAQRRARGAGARWNPAGRERRARQGRRLHPRPAERACRIRRARSSARNQLSLEPSGYTWSSGISPRSSFCCTSSQYATVSRSQFSSRKQRRAHAVHELHAVLEFLGQKNHPTLEKPGRNRLLAGFAVRVGADLHVGELFDRIVVEQEHTAVAAHAVVPGVQVLVEDVGGGIVANAVSKTDDHLARLGLIGGLQIHRQRNDLHLHDQRAQKDAVLFHLHAAGRLAAQAHREGPDRTSRDRA